MPTEKLIDIKLANGTYLDQRKVRCRPHSRGGATVLGGRKPTIWRAELPKKMVVLR